MKCPNCQHENPEEAKFCRDCGTSLEQDIICPNCGSSHPPCSKFCIDCGHDLSKPKETPPVDYSEPQSYTPKHLADKILTTRSSIEGERKLVTVFFADVANYTSISEKLHPEEVHQIMDGAFKILMDEIHKYEGTINQFTGDGVMALFGAPVAHEDHAQRACYAALSIQKAIEEYGNKIQKDTGAEFKMRVGLNSGPVIVGSIGDDLRMDYTAVGDTTNLAARMEGLAKPASILASENTHRLVKDFFELKPLGPVKVKGKEELQAVYELEKAGEAITRFDASVAKGLTRFVGRKNSMAALWDAWEKAVSGSGQMVGLVGEAGVGKSRLLLEFRNRLSPGEVTCLEGRCLHFGGSMPYLPFLDIMRSFFGIEEDDREFIVKKKITDKITELDEKLTHALTPAQSLLSLKVDDEAWIKLEPQDRKEKTFEALRDLFIRISQDRPLILAVEDLHWIDRTSEEFLDYLIGWLANTPILLILLYRPEYTHQWGSRSYYCQIGVDQLTIKSSAELVSAILEGGGVVPELRELILNRAAGNPLYMEELTHSMLENGSIEKRDNQYALSEKAATLEVPNTIQGIIAARIDRLEENLKRTMQVASVIGRDFAFRLLQTVTGMREDLKRSLLNLQGLEFIYEKQIFPELEYIFKHAMIQEVAYDSLLLMRRKELHQRIGQAIEEIYSERLEELYEMLAYHYSKAESFEKAYKYMKLSAIKSTQNYSLIEAFGFYKEAVRILKQLPDNEDRKREMVELIMLMDNPMRLIGYPDECIQYLQEGEQVSKELGDERSLATFYSIMGLYYTFKADFEKSIQYAENCYQEAQKIQDIDLMAPAAMELCASYLASGDNAKIIDLAPKIIELIEKTQKQAETFGRPFNVYSPLLSFYGLCLSAMGDFTEGEVMCERGIRNALEIYHLATLCDVEWAYGFCLFVKGKIDSAIEHFKNSIKYGEEGQALTDLALAHGYLGWAYSHVGELEAALEHVEYALKFFRDVGFFVGEVIALIGYGMIYFESGDLESSENYFKEALILCQKNKHQYYGGYSQIWLGRALARKDIKESGIAEKYILEGVKVLEACNFKPWHAHGYLFLGELYADLGQKERAMENLKKAESMYREMGMSFWPDKVQEVLDRL